MIGRKKLLASICLVLCLSIVSYSYAMHLSSGTNSRSTISATKPYDPWMDYLDDGVIDIKDLVYIISIFGTYGTPINKTEILYELLDKINSLNTTVIELENTVNYLNTTVVYLNETVAYLNNTYLGNIPVGVIIPYAKSLAGVPSIPDNFVECNGQILDDPESPLHGQTIPNLNGEHRFLRGSTTSGSIGGSETHKHHLTENEAGSELYASVQGDDIRLRGKSGYGVTQYTTATSTLPSYYEVVWIMRVK